MWDVDDQLQTRELAASRSTFTCGDEPTSGTGPCSFPSCSGGGGFRPCTGFTGTAQDCLNCAHDYSYHA